MQTLNRLNNVQRAKLLFDLLPVDIPEYIEFTKAIAGKVMADPEALRENWDVPLLSVDMWVRLARVVSEVIKKYGDRLSKSSKLFSDQLFDGYLALFSTHCLQKFVERAELKEPAFKTAVQLLF